jgi:thiamine pyrophosphokinase
MGTQPSSSELYQTVICLNGELPAADFFYQWAHLPLIAADGAANHLVEQGVLPEFVVGDGDSITDETYAIVASVSQVFVVDSQENNDFEKCLLFAQQQHFTNILVVGFHGGLLEHTLNNWSVLMRYAPSLAITLEHNGRIAVPVFSQCTLATTPGEIVSLIPQPQAVVSTSGLQWPLDNETLSLGVREGARNRAIGTTITITVHSGCLLCFFDTPE